MINIFVKGKLVGVKIYHIEIDQNKTLRKKYQKYSSKKVYL